MTLDSIPKALLSCTDNVYHYFAPPDSVKAPWVTWAEQRKSGTYAGDHQENQVIYGAIDLFTLEEDEPLVSKIEVALDAADIVFELEAVLYEDDTGLIHYNWSFEVA